MDHLIESVPSLERDYIEKMWKEDIKIALYSHDAWMGEFDRKYHSEAPLISMSVAQRILRQALPFAKLLSDKRREYNTDQQETFLEIGDHLYRVGNDEQNKGDDNHVQLFKFIVQNETYLTELDLYRTPADELKMLFSSKKITKVVGFNVSLSLVHEVNAAEKIEELELDCSDSAEDLKTFQGNFSNLKKLHLVLTMLSGHICRTEEPLHCLSQILPSVARNIKSFRLSIKRIFKVDLAADYFKHIFNFSQIEEFDLRLPHYAKIESMDYFFDKLVSSCPKLRIVHINGLVYEDYVVFKLMKLPNLTTLHFDATSSLCPEEVPKNSSILNLYIYHYCVGQVHPIVSLCLKMPKLRNVRLFYFEHKHFFEIAYNLREVFPTKRIAIKLKFDQDYKFESNENEVMVIEKERQEVENFSEDEVLNVTLYSSCCSLDERIVLLDEVMKDLKSSELNDYDAYWFQESKVAK